MKVNHRWGVRGWISAAELIDKCKRNAFEIAEIYGATAYLKGVQMTRDLFLGHFGVLVCALFLISGLLIFEAGLVYFIPVKAAVKALLVFALGAAHVLTGMILWAKFASSKQWLRQASRHSATIQAILEKNNGNGVR